MFGDPTERVGCNDVYEGKSVIDFGWVFRLISSKGLISRDFTVRVAYNDVDKGKSVIGFGWVSRLLSSKGPVSRDPTVRVIIIGIMMYTIRKDVVLISA